MILQQFSRTFSLPTEKLAELVNGRGTFNRGWGEDSAQTQIFSLAGGDSGVRQQSWLLRTVWWWGKICNCKESILWFRENNFWEVNGQRGNNSLPVCSLAYILLSHQALRKLAKNITFTVPVPRLFYAKEETCSPAKHMFWVKCALCVWQQWQSIYPYPEKESTLLYLVLLLERSTGIPISSLVVHAEIVDFLLFLE